MSRYLQHVCAKRYGALEDRRVGPFGPGMNVVFGPNEAGKTTIASLIGGVLFGWEEARGVRNTYRPANGERSASLTWAESLSGYLPSDEESADWADDLRGLLSSLPADVGTTTVSREKNEDGLQGDRSVVSDIDRATYSTMFSLTSDELRSLRNTSDVTARLLAAGSGTGSSPSGTYVELEQRIAAHTSLASDAQRSVVRLAEQLGEKQAEIRAATEQAELYKQEDRELRELSLNRADAAARIELLNREIEDLASWRAEFASIDEKVASRQEELSGLLRERDVLAGEGASASAYDRRLLELDAAEERVLRDKLDEYAEAREKAERIVDTAKENSATSTAAYEALVELDQTEVPRGRSARDRAVQAAITIAPTLVFILAGIPLFVHGRQINSLSFTALGVGLVVFAFFLAISAIVFLFRPSWQPSGMPDRKKDAQWVMLQDRKKLDSSQVEAARLEDDIRSFLEGAGLADANGSLRQARSLLDDAREERTRRASESQRAAALGLRVESLEEELEALSADRRRIEEDAGLSEGASKRDVDESIRVRSVQRDALLEMADGMSIRYGELSRSLEQAKADRSFDELKLEYQQLRTQLKEGKRELVELLLAKRMLERSIAAWESRNQPEVYAEASRLLELITDGAWVKVLMSSSGSISACSAQGDVREPRHLSLGMCQQLYLSLRIALLLTAEHVGEAIPVLADDILVNFDSVRRAGAARALAQLAEHRQVIVFTCHEETVDALREAAPDLTLLSISH